MTTAAATRTVEVVLFRANPGVGDEEIMEVADALQREVEAFSGYIGRCLLKSEDGEWIDLVDWTSLDGALEASRAILERPVAQAFEALVDGESVRILHLTPVRVYDASSADR